jgi:hypothetical protein
MAVKVNKRNIDDVFDEEYKKIRESLSGLEEIFKINLLENNIYYQCATDNLKSIHETIISLLKHMYSPREVRMRLREIEYDELEAQESYI